MRPFGGTISLDEARKRIDAAVKPIDRTERVALAGANGRVIAEDALATADVPPFARAAMDGYAVRAQDTAGASKEHARVLTRVETLYTGQVTQRTIGAGECIEIATGAPMPPGADAVVIVEDTDGEASGAVRVFASVQTGTEHRPPGGRHPQRPAGASGGYDADAEPCGGPRRAWAEGCGRVRPAAHRHPFHGQ